jgi:type I restriction enzyme, S subunit
MNQDRASTITNSQLKEGYKQTEVGIIPEDWEVDTIGQSMRLLNGRAFRPIDWVEQGIPIIRIQNLNDSDALFNYCSADTKIEDKHRIEFGDIVFAWSGTKGTSFGARIWTGLSGVLNQHIFKVIPDRRKLVPHYAFLILLNIQEEIEKQAHGFKASFVHVKKSDLIGVNLPIPSIPEQEAIAHTLSDIDALIESLDRLLTKKRQIKQGAMQELLRSKDGWEKKHIGDVLTISHGRSQHEVVDENGDYPILASGGQIGRAKAYLYNKPSVLIGRKGTIDKPQYMDRPFWTVDTLFYSIIHEPNNAKYLFYQFCLIPWREYNEASGVPSLNARTIESIEITVPSPEEQIEIASILSDMDAEIGSIESKLTKTLQLKQGMMHELLTGRIRLVNNTSIS